MIAALVPRLYYYATKQLYNPHIVTFVLSSMASPTRHAAFPAFGCRWPPRFNLGPWLAH